MSIYNYSTPVTNKTKKFVAENRSVFNNYFYQFSNVCLSLFKWDGLDGLNIHVPYLEESLYTKGSFVFYYDEIADQYCVDNGWVMTSKDRYGEPNSITISNPYVNYNRDLNKQNGDKFVIVYNNKIMTPSIIFSTYIANKITKIERTQDTNIVLSKMSYLIGCNEEQKLTMENIVGDVDQNKPYIFVNKKNQIMDDVKIFNTQTPYIADKLEILKQEYITLFYNTMGVENSLNAKRERVITDEINANLGSIEKNRESLETPRKYGCDLINKTFGLNLSVNYDTNVSLISSEINVSEKGINEIEDL